MKAIGAGFGLLVFLISVAIMFWMWSMYTSEMTKHALPAKKQAQQFAGYDENSRPAMNSLQLAGELKDGKLEYMLVETIRPQGAMAKMFKLQVDDKIVAAGIFNFKEYGYDE